MALKVADGYSCGLHLEACTYAWRCNCPLQSVASVTLGNEERMHGIQ